MSETFSNMIPLGTKAAPFKLYDVISDAYIDYNSIKGSEGTLIFFICNHCPFVHHVIEEITRIANDYRVQGIGFAAICSNDISAFPEDSPNKMYDFAFEHGFGFPYLWDDTQEIAKKYQANCTPDFFLFNRDNHLVYRGQIDDSRPGNNISQGGTDMRGAIDGLLYNRTINPNQKPSTGCNIKWKKISTF